MIAFTRKTDYALLALAALADAGSRPSPTPLSARQIATTYHLSHPLVMNVLKDLAKGGIVGSTRGAKGGYALLRDPGGITVQEVLVAIEGQPALAACCGDVAVPDSADCQVSLHCPITHAVQRLNDRIQGFLGEITLADLIHQSNSAGSPAPQIVPLSALRTSAKGAS
jgi:Rrf2 family protein